MASFDYRLNPLYAIKQCSSCGALYTTDYCCSKGGLVDKIIRERPPQHCATCGDPVDGMYCRPCAFVRKCLNEGWYTIHDENEILNTFESSNDNTNIVSAPQEPFVFNQDPGKNSSQSPPHIDHHCCYECGDSLDDIFCQRCTFLTTFNPLIYRQSPIFNAQNDSFHSQNKLMEKLTSVCDMVGQYIQNKEEEKRIKEEQAAKSRYWKIPVCYDDDDVEERSISLKDTIISGLPPCVAITPALSTEEPVDSLIMENEHLDTILETESDEFINSSVENLVQNPSQSEDFFDIKSEYDMPVCDNFMTFSNLLFDANDDFSSSDDESFSDEDVPNEIYSNPLFDEEIISVKIDAWIISMIDSILKQFSGELAHNDLIPPGIIEADFDLEEDIRFIKRL
ncbi:hypothetical protein Tco_0233656 [Tanacetum coccineum]